MTPDLPRVVHRTPPTPLSWTYEVSPALPMVWRGVVPDSARRELIGYWHEAHGSGHGLPSAFADGGVPPAELVMPPEEYHSAIDHLLFQTANHFHLPFVLSSAQSVLARYPTGAGTDWHLDAGKKKSDRRTVAFTMLLSANFEDGCLETDPGGPVEMTAGDVCGFTSRTWHRVAPVRSGERFALLAFGGF